jgi:hypothetical protein
MNINTQIIVKNKALAVVESCKTLEQLVGAKKYVERYNLIFSDLIGYSELSRLILKKQTQCLKN